MDILQLSKVEFCDDCGQDRDSSYVIRTNASSISADHLKALANGTIRVVHVEAFASETACNVICTGQVDLGFKPYINVEQVRRIGMAYYETENKPSLIAEYSK